MEQEEPLSERTRRRERGGGRTCSDVETHGGSGEERGEEAAPLAAWVAGAPHLRPGWHPARWYREARGGDRGGRGMARGRNLAPPLVPSVPRR